MKLGLLFLLLCLFICAFMTLMNRGTRGWITFICFLRMGLSRLINRLICRRIRGFKYLILGMMDLKRGMLIVLFSFRLMLSSFRKFWGGGTGMERFLLCLLSIISTVLRMGWRLRLDLLVGIMGRLMGKGMVGLRKCLSLIRRIIRLLGLEIIWFLGEILLRILISLLLERFVGICSLGWLIFLRIVWMVVGILRN